MIEIIKKLIILLGAFYAVLIFLADCCYFIKEMCSRFLEWFDAGEEE